MPEIYNEQNINTLKTSSVLLIFLFTFHSDMALHGIDAGRQPSKIGTRILHG